MLDPPQAQAVLNDDEGIDECEYVEEESLIDALWANGTDPIFDGF